MRTTALSNRSPPGCSKTAPFKKILGRVSDSGDGTIFIAQAFANGKYMPLAIIVRRKTPFFQIWDSIHGQRISLVLNGSAFSRSHWATTG